MPKIISWTGLILGALLFLIFSADLFMGILGRPSGSMDVGLALAAALLAVLGWLTLREQR